MKMYLALPLLVASASLWQESVEDLLVHFTTKDAHAKARDALLEQPARKVLKPLVHAIRTDANLSSSNLYRSAAYDILTKKGGQTEDGRLVYEDSDQVAQMIRGLEDPSGPIRGMCLRALGRVGPEFRSEAVNAAAGFLTDKDPRMISVAVGVLTELGPSSSPALPALRQVLVDGPEVQPDYSGEGMLEKGVLVQQIRQSAAFARIAIAGVGVDLDTYPQLDAQGRMAAIDALMPVVMRDQILTNDPRSSIPRGGSPPITRAEREKLTSFFDRHSRDLTSEIPSRKKAVVLLGVIASRKDAEDPSSTAAHGHLHALAKDSDPIISAAAQEQLQVLGK